MNKEIRLTRFYETLDNLYCEHVEEVKNAIADGEINPFTNKSYEEPTKEKTFNKIYDGIIKQEDLKFLTSDFIKQEINKYYDNNTYWAEIRKQYKLN